MNRKEKVLSYINSKEYIPLKFDELMIVLDVPPQDSPELLRILDELAAEGEIILSKKQRYAPLSGSSDCFAGQLSCSARGYFGFLTREGGDIFIAGDSMNGALDGDRVLVRVTKKGGYSGHDEGRVIKILERANKTVVGIIYKEKNGYLCLRPDDARIYAEVLIMPQYAQNAEIGSRAAAEITEYAKDGRVFGKITAVLGDVDSLSGIIEGVIVSGGIKQTFDEETLAEADRVPPTVTEAQIYGREDLRDALTFTIDGDDARDFDDAVSAEMTEDGNYLLGVHIADVSEYVRENTALDREAFERGTSVYLADRVIPMLPESLSNGICSLNPNADRLTLSCFMEITPEGEVIKNRLAKTVIRSKERMTYNNVNKILEEGDAELVRRYEYMLPTLKIMEQLAQILRKKRERRGAIQFDFPECRVIVNEDGEPEDIVKEIRGTSNKMIEEFMLAANETVAEFAYWSEIPFVYRSHEPPSAEKIKAFNQLILRFGLRLKGKIDEDNPVRPKALQRVLDDIKDMPEERIVMSNMLRSLMKAKYTDTNLGHFGLAAQYYCHFTSPIRRYPDLAVHRILKKMLDGTLSDSGDLKAFTSKAALHSSDCEVNAEMTERTADDIWKAAYMSRFIGEAFDATVVSVTNFGMFAALDNTVEGLIRLENMTDDYYDYDEPSMTLTGRRNGGSFTVGDGVKVVVAGCEILSGQIDFVLEEDASHSVMKRIERKNAKRDREKEYGHKRKKKRYE